MGPNTQELVVTLNELAALLEGDGEIHRRVWMLRARSYLENSDYYGIECLLGAYGGMGSFNDLVLGQSCQDGVLAWKTGQKELNQRLEELRFKAWKLAQEMKRQHQLPRA